MCHTVKDSDVPQESPTAMVMGQRGCVPRNLRLPWLPFWKLSSEFRALKKILLNLSSLCPQNTQDLLALGVGEDGCYIGLFGSLVGNIRIPSWLTQANMEFARWMSDD